MPYKKGRPVIDLSIFFRIATFLTFYPLWPFAMLINYLMFFTRYKYRYRMYNVKRAITVSNHTTFLDPVKISGLVLPRFMYQTLLEATVLFPFVGTLTRLLGGVPIPVSRDGYQRIHDICEHSFKKSRFFHFYSEGECFLYNQKINELKPGAFRLAAELDIPLIPLVTVLTEGPFPAFSFWGRSLPFEQLVVLEPVNPADYVRRNENGEISPESVKEFAEAVRQMMQAEIDKRGGSHVFYKGQMQRIKGLND